MAKAVLIRAITPLMLKTPANRGGTPIEAFDQIRAGVLADRSDGCFYGKGVFWMAPRFLVRYN